MLDIYSCKKIFLLYNALSILSSLAMTNNIYTMIRYSVFKQFYVPNNFIFYMTTLLLNDNDKTKFKIIRWTLGIYDLFLLDLNTLN